MALELLAIQNRCNFERKFGKYTILRTYKIDCSPEHIIGLEYGPGVGVDGIPTDNRVPGNVQIKDGNSALCGGSGVDSGGTTITCYATDRDAVNPENEAGIDFTELNVTYVGWKLGVRPVGVPTHQPSCLTLTQRHVPGVTGDDVRITQVAVRQVKPAQVNIHEERLAGVFR